MFYPFNLQSHMLVNLCWLFVLRATKLQVCIICYWKMYGLGWPSSEGCLMGFCLILKITIQNDCSRKEMFP